ncbi:phage major capsid protein [Rhodococcus erythropolis]|uniref:phage major capsid protein n=1 Tax=Rhodococcus erythropolis TaxID=1833 RepID=UPI00366B0849
MNEIANQRFISDFILTSRQDVSGGAIVFDQDDPLYTDRPVEAISPGAEYPLAGVGSGTPQAVRVTKWGQDVPITDEKIKRSNFSPVEKAFNTIVNQIVKTIDSLSLSLVASQVTATQAAASTWSGVDPTILRDIMLAKAKVTGLNKGYDPDVIVVDDATWAILASDDKLSTLMAREDKGNSVYTGEFRTIAGLTILPTPNLPAAGAWIIDTNALGGIGDEKLGEGYAGDIVETKSIRDEDNDQWRVRGRRVCVPYVNEPGAAIKITGI